MKKPQIYKIYQRTKLAKDWTANQNAAKETRQACKNAYNKYLHETVFAERKSNPKKSSQLYKIKNQDNVGISDFSPKFLKTLRTDATFQEDEKQLSTTYFFK